VTPAQESGSTVHMFHHVSVAIVFSTAPGSYGLDEWSDSNIRTPLRRALLRMLESKDHSKTLILVELWI